MPSFVEDAMPRFIDVFGIENDVARKILECWAQTFSLHHQKWEEHDVKRKQEQVLGS